MAAAAPRRLDTADNWRIPGHAAVVMRPVRAHEGSMADLIRVLPKARSSRPGFRPAPARGMAGHQRPRRLRLGHGERRHHAPLSRPADRRAAQSAGPHDDAERPLRASAAARPPRGLHRRRGTRRHHAREHAATSPSSAWKPACRCGDTSGTASCWRSGCSCRTGRTPFTSSTSCSPGNGKLRLGLRPADPLPLARCARSARPQARSTC